MLKYVVYFSAWEPDIPLIHRCEHGDTLNHDETKVERQICHLKLTTVAQLAWMEIE